MGYGSNIYIYVGPSVSENYTHGPPQIGSSILLITIWILKLIVTIWNSQMSITQLAAPYSSMAQPSG